MNKPDLGELFETALKNNCTVHLVIQGHAFIIKHLQAVRATGHNVGIDDHDPIYDKYFAIADSAPKGSLILVGSVCSGEREAEHLGTLIIDPQSVDAVFLS